MFRIIHCLINRARGLYVPAFSFRLKRRNQSLIYKSDQSGLCVTLIKFFPWVIVLVEIQKRALTMPQMRN
jgi:hypothetical protein